MATYTIVRASDGQALMQTSFVSCLPDADALAAMYASGLVLLEDGRKTTAARRKELLKAKENDE